ncbi:MAG: hypothetical protein M5U31_00385 [Acidimicrobiia bacterium]|nr:hypothetical protein [Acidimicrobiia bacterium]
MAGTGLALRRAVAVLTAAFVVLTIGTLALPGLGSAPLGWVTPALALAVGSLAIGTWVRVEIAVACLAGAWVVGVGALRYVDGPGHPFADTAVFSAVGQGVALGLAVLAAVVLVTRADRYTTLEVRT